MITGAYGGKPSVSRLLLIILPLIGAAVAAVLLLPPSAIKLAVLLFLALPCGMILFDRPRWIFYILIIVIFSNVDVFIQFRFFRLLVAFMLASLAFALLTRKMRIVVHEPIFTVLTIAFLLCVFQSMIVARDIDSSLYRLITFAKVLVNVAITIQFVRNKLEFRYFLLIMTLGLAMNNFLPFVLKPPEGHASLSLIWRQGVLRYEGFVFEPNTFALYQVYFVPVLLFLIAVYKKPRIARLLFLVVLLASIFVLFLSFSRGGFVSLIFLLVMLLIIERRNKIILLTGLTLISVGLILAPAVYWERVSSLLEAATQVSKDYALLTRIELMKIALIMGFRSPLFGVGVNNFLYHANTFVPFSSMIVHNTPLEIFSDLGLPAFTVYVGIICNNFRVIRNLMRRRDDGEAAQLGRILLIQHVSVMINSMFIPVAFNSILWFLLALPTIAGYAYRPKESAAAVSSGD